MKAEKNLEAARLVIEEAFSKMNFAVLPECFQPGFVEHQPGMQPGLDGLARDIAYLHKAFPDFSLTIDFIAADGDKVWLLCTGRGTDTGGFMGPPSGKSFQIAVFDLLRFDGGRIVEHWGSPDRLSLLRQLGKLPEWRGEAARQPE